MRKYWYRRILIMIVVFLFTVGGGYYLEEFQQNKLKAEVNAKTSSENMVIPGGMPIGIYLETEGVMILGTDSITAEDGMDYEPAANLVKAGDYIVAINNQAIDDKSELIEAVNRLEDQDAVLRVRRGYSRKCSSRGWSCRTHDSRGGRKEREKKCDFKVHRGRRDFGTTDRKGTDL